MAWNSDSFEQRFNQYDDDCWYNKVFSSRASKLFEDLETSADVDSDSKQNTGSSLSDDWETKGFSSRASKLFEDLETSADVDSDPKQNTGSSLSDDWETKGFSSRAAALFDEDVSGTRKEAAISGKIIENEPCSQVDSSVSDSIENTAFHKEETESFAENASDSHCENSTEKASCTSTTVQSAPDTNAHDNSSKLNASSKTVKQEVHKRERNQGRNIPPIPKTPKLPRQNIAETIDIDKSYLRGEEYNLQAQSDDLLNEWLKSDKDVQLSAPKAVVLSDSYQSPRQFQNTYYDDEIESKLKIRGVLLIMIWVIMIIGGIALLINGHVIILFVLILLGAFFINVIHTSRTEVIKRNIVHSELCRYFDKVKYVSNESVNELSSSLQNTLIQFDAGRNLWNAGEVSDRFSGIFRGLEFRYFDVILNLVVGSGKNQSKKKVFGGQLIELTLNQEIERPILLRRRQNLLQDNEKKYLRSLGFKRCDQDLMEEFEINPIDMETDNTGKPKISVQQINLPRLFAALCTLEKRCGGTVQIKIVADKMYFRVERDYDPFEFQSGDSFRSAEYIRQRVSKEVQENQFILNAMIGG